MLYKLTILRDHIIWGHLSPLSVRDLIMKRGRMGTLKDPSPLTDNIKIEHELGHVGIICLEDLVFELTKSDSQNFQICSKFLLPFQLSIPEGGKRAVTNFSDSELKPGFRNETALEELIDKMV